MLAESDDHRQRNPAHLAFARYRARRHFGNLDGLRCLSILPVIWYHGPGARLGGYAANGTMGVPLFFAISGFLITTLLLREWDQSGTISLSGFYARRALRIFPLYYGVLLLYIGLVWMTARPTPAGRTFLENVPYFLTYTSNWFVGTSGTFAFAWSLAAEEQFYSSWPWAVRYLSPRRAIWVVAGLLGVALWWNLSGLPAGSFVLTIVGSVQMSICWGCLCAFLLHDPSGFAAAWRLLGHSAASPVILVAILAVLATPYPSIPVHLLFACLVGACVMREDTRLSPVLQWRPVVHVGAISYGMYMLHGLVYNILDLAGDRLAGWNAHGVDGFVVATLVTTAVATMSFQYFEGPFLRLKTRFARA